MEKRREAGSITHPVIHLLRMKRLRKRSDSLAYLYAAKAERELEKGKGKDWVEFERAKARALTAILKATGCAETTKLGVEMWHRYDEMLWINRE